MLSSLRMRRIAGLCLLALTAALLAPASGSAALTRKKSIWGPAAVGGASQFPIYADLGVGLWQTRLSWAEVATRRPAHPRDPADPAYGWPPALDAAIADAGRHGVAVSLLVMDSPAWTNGGRAPRWAPTSPTDFADFLVAAARHFPSVRHWMIWGEPTKASNFQPLRKDHGRRLRGRALNGPRKYARMLDAAYGALKGVSRANLVIGGNTFTVGTVSPRRWIQALRLPNGRPPRMDLYGHNPFSARRPLLSQPPLGRGYADFGDLDTLAGWLDHDLKGARPGGGRLKLFLSEISFPTGHANFEFNFWMDEPTQASWVADALRDVRRSHRIYTFGYLGLYDDALRPDGLQVERGLIRRDRTRKLSYEAFKRG
jgi:hypothetical protein